MCGIIYSDKIFVVDNIESHLDLIHHRGPDNQNYMVRNKSVFGHTRLSFLDLSEKGTQPFISECGNYCLIFNGEIYNFKHLRSELQKENVHFNTNTDTEVLFHGLIVFGIDFASRLDGMFSLVFEDRRSNKIHFLRDSFGMKPLYIEQDKDGVLVGSELKLFRKRQTDQNSIIDFLLFGYIPEPNTIFNNVKSVPTNKYLTYDLSTKKITQHKWTPDPTTSYDIEKSLQLSLTSDVPVATFFSGGFDSTVLSYNAKKANNNNNCFGLGFQGFKLDESNKQLMVSSALNLDAETYQLSNFEIEESLHEFLSALDYPTIDGFNTYLLSKKANELGYKACISGLGADELFAGYPSFTDDKQFQTWEYAKYVPAKILSHLPKFKRLCWLQHSKIFGKYLARRGLFIPDQVSDILGIPLTSVINRLRYHEGQVIKNCFEPLPFYLEQNYYMKGQLLRDADYFSMLNSVEVRMPFLNVGIRNLALAMRDTIMGQTSPKQSIINMQTKQIREIFSNIPKQGFILPYEKWIKEFNLGGSDIENLSDNPTQAWALAILDRF